MDFASSARALADQYDRQATGVEEDDGIDQDEEGGEEMIDRMELFMPVVQRLVGALGGFEDIVNPDTQEVETVYRPGDSALAVMRDLKRLWRKDDTDDERTVFRCFAKAGLCNELVSLLDECTGRGQSGRKMALAAADLLAALTWPIDVQQELKDMLEDAETVVTDYASLLRSQVEYKALILKSGSTIQHLMVLLLPSLALSGRDRTERDKRIVSLMLYLVRNLLAIRDPIGSGISAGDTMELGSMQSRLIVQLEESRFLPLLLTLAENAGKGDYEEYNVLVLDSLWLMFRAVEVDDLLRESSQVAAEALGKLLDEEDRSKQQAKRTGNSRHSRFGTTIVMKAGSDRYVLHKQSSISTTAGAVLDGIKRKRAGKVTKQDELTIRAGGVTMLTEEALAVMKPFARQFLYCFDNFFHSILKDIRMGRAKIRDTDNLRVLFLCRFFMEYFLAVQQQDQDRKAQRERERELSKRQAEKSRDPFADLGFDDDAFMAELDQVPSEAQHNDTEVAEDDSELDFRLLAEVFQDETRGWLGRRLGEAKDAKPRGDLEIQACLDFFTQLLLVIGAMSNDKDEEILELSDTLSAKLLQNAEFIETAYDCLKTYKQQSMAYLDSAINFCYTLIRTLEVYSKDGGQIHIRKKRELNKRKKNKQPDDVDMDNEEEQAAALEKATATYTEHARQFRDFEKALADERIVSTLIRYLGRYREFNDPKKLKRLVSLMHRIVVSVSADAFFYKVSGFEVFKRVLEDQRTLPAGQATKDLLACINYILRKFFKNLQQNPLLAIEAFWPKPRGHLRKLSSADSDRDDSENDDPSIVKAPKIPADLEFKPDKEFTWSQKLGIAIRCLIDERKVHWVMWLVEALRLVCVARREIILSTDDELRVYDPDIDDTRPRVGPSEEAKEKLADHILKPDTDEQAAALVYNPHLKLLCTLLRFEQDVPEQPEAASRVIWTIPKILLPEELESSIRVVETFMREPMSLDGVTPAELLRRKRKKPAKKRRRKSLDEERAPRRRKQAEEVQQYKSAQFIDDSDGDVEADAAFFAREAANREAHRKNISLGAGEPVRQSPGSEERPRSIPRRHSRQLSLQSNSEPEDDDRIQSHAIERPTPHQAPERQRPRPRAGQPQTRKKASSHAKPADLTAKGVESDDSDENLEEPETIHRANVRARKRVMLASSDEDETG